jgi:hypothetical protein
MVAIGMRFSFQNFSDDDGRCEFSFDDFLDFYGLEDEVIGDILGGVVDGDISFNELRMVFHWRKEGKRSKSLIIDFYSEVERSFKRKKSLRNDRRELSVNKYFLSEK